MILARQRAARRRGIVWTVEAAVVLPLLLLFLFAVFEFARFLFVNQLINNAAREGARYAVVNVTTATTTQVQNYVNNYLAGQGVQLKNFTPANNIKVFQADPVTGKDTGNSWQNTPACQSIGVTVTGTYTPVIGGTFKLLGNTQVTILGPTTVQATAIMMSEAN
jgi:Flp pilus assembly protein TadG